MVSFSSGSLSGDVPNKRPLENGYVPKYKSRKVSAVRDFPPRCGRDAVLMNLNTLQNGANASGIMEAGTPKNSETTNSVMANHVGVPGMDVLMEPEAVGNSETTNRIESDGLETAEIPKFVKLVEIKNPETLGPRGVEVSNNGKECQLDEAVKSNADADMTENLDALEEKVMVNANGFDKLAMEIRPCGIQLPKDVEHYTHDTVNNPIKVDGAESLDTLMGKVIQTATADGSFNDFEELIADPELVAVDKLNDSRNDSSEGDAEAGSLKMLKESNKVEDLALIQNSVLGEAKHTSNVGDSVGKEPVQGSSQASSSSSGSIKPEVSIRLKDKYRWRRVSAVRDFPPHCGRNVPLPTEEEKQMVTAVKGCLDNTQKVEVEPETTLSKNVSEGGAIGEMVITSQRECLDELVNAHVKKEITECLDELDHVRVKIEKTETLNDGERGLLGDMMEDIVEGGVMASEECNRVVRHSNIEEMEARQALPGSGTMSNALADTSFKETGGGPEGREIAVCSPDRNDKVRASKNGFSLGGELHREVVHGLMAAPYCPWRKAKVALNNSGGRASIINVQKQNLSWEQKSKAVDSKSIPKGSCSGGSSQRKTVLSDADGNPDLLTIMVVEDHGSHDGRVAEITPISMSVATPDSDGDSTGPVGKDIVVYSPGQSGEMRYTHSVFNSEDEADREVMHSLAAAPFCPWRNAKEVVSKSDGGMSGGKKGKQNLSWRRKAKAVAKKSTPKFLGSPSKKHDKVHISNNTEGSRGALVPADDQDYGLDGDFPTNSPANRKPLDFEVSLPPFGHKAFGLGDARNRVRDTLRVFHVFCRKLLQQEEAKSMQEEEGKSRQSGKKPNRIDLLSAKMIKDVGKEVNTEKQCLGQVPGVEVGDEFQYRVELALVGVHRLYQAGIDWMKRDGVPVATSIVASGGYADDMENADVLIYSGQGGNVVGRAKQPEDQKLERGNLALWNSISARTPVRVVRGWRETMSVDPSDPKPKMVSTYVYDGLYTVTNYWTETGTHGKLVFMFELRRNPGQPELAWKELKKSSKSKTRPGVCVGDISGGKEPFPICAVNTIDDEKPPSFNYIRKMMYPHWYNPIPPAGCDCTGRCSDSNKCRCAVRNGGEIPYNRNGAIVEMKPLVYECGPHCKCPPSCYNRVSQRGIKFQLEVFKTQSRGWGVRALTSIPSGSFICEYAGELLEDKEAEQRIGNDEYLFDIGHNYSDHSVTPEDRAFSVELKEEGGYTIDAAQYGNVGRFINHSCVPNLYAQNVIYDHDDKKMPHVMLFAMENIPPLQELTYHYNYSVDQIRDSDGNIKVKKCYCGTAECTGRMY